MMLKKFLLLFLLAVPLSSRAQEKAAHLIFTPQASAQAQFAGFYVALEKGFYAEEGLDIEIVHPFATQSPEDIIRKGSCQVSTLTLSQAMRLVDKGFPLVNILQTSMNSATVILSRWGEDPMKLKGAKVAAFRSGSGQLAQCLSTLENLDYRWIPTASIVNLFIGGAVDATLGRSFDEYYRILQTGLIQPDKGIYRFEDHAYNVQQDGVYVTRAFYRAHPEQAEGFARASRRGWDWAAEHPQETLDLVMRYVKEFRIETNRTLQQLMLDEVLRLQKGHDSGIREFRLLPEMVDKANDMMLRAGLTQRKISIDELLP